ncbi:MAG: AI-2E family transporter [Clostridia bacterium]
MHNKRWHKHLELVPVIIISLILYKYIDSSELFSRGFGYIVSLFSYFLWATILAYFLNPFVKWIERRIKIRRIITIFLVYTIVFSFIYLFFRALTPRLVDNISELIENIPEYYTIALSWLNETIAQLEVNDTLGIIPAIQNAVGDLTQATSMALNQILNSLLDGVARGTSFLTTFVFSVVIAAYMLYDKEIISQTSKRIVRAFTLNEQSAQNIFNFAEEVDDVFSRYLNGRVIDSTIIGLLCYILMIIFSIPYAAVLSFTVGVTNLIPYFGPFIGMIPVFIISLFSGIWVAITGLVLVFALQQFDGFYLGPLIMGGKVGLRPLWIILAISVGGKLYGVVGMFLGVPIMAVLKRLLDAYIDSRLENKTAMITTDLED